MKPLHSHPTNSNVSSPFAEEPWRTIFCILTLDGLRAGEVLGLKWGDIDFDRSLLHIRRTAWYGKIQTAMNEASETVLPIPSSLLTALKNYRATWKPNGAGFLFVTRNGRPPSSNKVVEYHLWTILDALGIPRCGLHAFRHAHIHRYSLTPAQHPKLCSVNCDTPMLGLR